MRGGGGAGAVVLLVHEHGVYGHLGGDGVLGVLLHRLEGEVGDEEADDIALEEGVLAFGVVGGELGDGPGDHALHLHGRVLEDLGEGGADAGEHHELDALGVTAEEADGERGGLLALGAALLDEAEQRRDAVLLDDEPPVAVIVAREGDDAGGGVGAGLGVAGVEDGDLLPDEEENGLVLRDGREADVVVEVVGVAVVGDAEDPGEVAEGVVQLVGRLLEGAGGDDGEDAADEAVAAAPVEQRGGLVERLAGVFEVAAGGPLVEVGAGGLAEEGGEALDLGLEVEAFLPARLRLLRPLDHLLRQLDRPRQDRLEVVHLRSTAAMAASARAHQRQEEEPPVLLRRRRWWRDR
uniref:Uncharacterized protein n=1 Tax=Oryza brachyantha TaxID=4533 RepID=J3MV20_ORYBR